MLKLIIADDVENVRQSLAKDIAIYCPNVKLVASVDGVNPAIKAIKEHKPDVVLLDVEMRDGTGFDVLKEFPSPSFKVIFITAYQHYSLEAFRFSALDYILKPVDPDLLKEAIEKATDIIDREKLTLKIESFMQNMQEENRDLKKIVLKTSESIHVTNLKDILYCEASSGYTTFYLNDSSRIVVTKPLTDYDDMLSDKNFIRIHQTYLINLHHIKRYEKGDGGFVILANNAKLPVSTRKKEYLMQVLSKL